MRRGPGSRSWGEGMAVVDASGQIVGRFSSAVAKRLLGGEEVVVVNAEKAGITGSTAWLTGEFRHRRGIWGPRERTVYPRRPGPNLPPSVRGKLPHQQPPRRAAPEPPPVVGDGAAGR